MLRHRPHLGVLPLALLAALTVLALTSGGSTVARAAAPDGTTQLLVKFTDGTAPGRSADALAAVGAKETGSVPDLGVKVISVPDAAADAVLQHLRSDEDVAYAEPNVQLEPQDMIPNDPSFPQQSAVAGGAWGWTVTHTTQAWDVTKGDPSVVIAILDTGLKTTGLADFDGQIASTYNAMTSVVFVIAL